MTAGRVRRRGSAYTARRVFAYTGGRRAPGLASEGGGAPGVRMRTLRGDAVVGEVDQVGREDESLVSGVSGFV